MADLERLGMPRLANGRFLATAIPGVPLESDPNRRDPVTAFGACLRWITKCVEPIGGPCLIGPVSYPANGVIEVPAGTYTLGVFPPSDPTCGGESLAGRRADGVKIRARRGYTAIAQVKQGDPSAFQLQLVRDF
jgi:hypothetical protein